MLYKRLSWCSTLRLVFLETTLIPFVTLEDPLRRAKDIKVTLEKKEGSSKKNGKHQGLAESIIIKVGQFILYGYQASWVKRMTPASFHEHTTFWKRRADIHGIPGALNRAVGALMIPVEHRPLDTRPVTIQPNSLNEPGDNRCCSLCQRQINLSKLSQWYHPPNECLTAGDYQVGVKLTINRATMTNKEVRAYWTESLYTVISLNLNTII